MRRRGFVLFSWPLVALGLSACATTVSTSSFKGEQHEVAQTVADLQADATAGEEKKICDNDLAGAVVTRLGGASRCEAAVKNALDQVDNLEVTVQSVALGAPSKPGAPAIRTASAQVKSIHSGKRKVSTVSLVKEAGKWKIAALG